LSIILILLFLLLVILRIPLAIAIGSVTMLYIWMTDSLSLMGMVLDVFQSLDRFPLLAVPLFILAGQLMATGGVAKRILHLADEIGGNIKGSYAIVTIFSCVFFGGLSGSAPATVAAIGSLMIPAMIKQGYDAGFAAGVAACSGVLAVIIPPSNPMIVYALVGNTSVGQLFLAGFIPGLILSLGMSVPAYIVSRKNGWGGDRHRGTWKSIRKAALNAKWALLAPVIILGGIYTGVFTPTESAAVACLYSFIIGLWVHRDFNWRNVPTILRTAALPVASVMLLVTFATALGNALTMEGVPQRFADYIGQITDSPILTILIINVMLLAVGCFMDVLAAIIILTPLLYPIVEGFGISPVHFGIIMVINLGIGFVTPPFGSNLFIANQICGTRIQNVFIGAFPLILGMIVALLLITFVPWLTLVIPGLFYK